MKIILPLLLAPLVLMGCQNTVGSQVDFAYAKPSRLGMYDPKATPAGTFYSWNTKTNRLTLNGEVKLTAGTPTAPRKVYGNRLAGFGVEGLPIADAKLVAAKIGGQFKTEVSDSIHQNFHNSKTALRDYVIARKNSGETTEDLLDTFRPKDQDYRTVVFISEERSGSAQFRVGGQETKGASIAQFKVELPGLEVVNVTVDALSTADCGKPENGSDVRPVCFTDVIVYDPFVKENGNLDWRIDDSYSQDALSDALRNR